METETLPQKPTETPDPQYKRGKCPVCGGNLYSHMTHTPGEGYIITWECAGDTGKPDCDYRRVI